HRPQGPADRRRVVSASGRRIPTALSPGGHHAALLPRRSTTSLTQRYLVGVPPEATGVATQTPRGTTGILVSALQRVQLGDQPAYESRPLLPLRSQLQPHRFHHGRAAMRLRNRGPLSGTASSKRPTEARLALIQSPWLSSRGRRPAVREFSLRFAVLLRYRPSAACSTCQTFKLRELAANTLGRGTH